jgi:hypothetical protein
MAFEEIERQNVERTTTDPGKYRLGFLTIALHPLFVSHFFWDVLPISPHCSFFLNMRTTSKK